MKDLSLAEAIRFLSPGVIFFVYLYFVYPAGAKEFVSTTGTIGFPLILFVSGSIIYFLYRAILYDRLIERLHILYRRKRQSARQFLMLEYEINFSDACLLWKVLRDTHLGSSSVSRMNHSAGLHMMYLLGLLAIPFLVITLTQRSWSKAFFFLATAIIALPAAFLHDAAYEEEECGLLKGIARTERDETAHRLGLSPKVDAPTAAQPLIERERE